MYKIVKPTFQEHTIIYFTIMMQLNSLYEVYAPIGDKNT